MVYNQLFCIKPTLEITNKLIKLFGLRDIHDKTEFSILNMIQNNTLTTFKNIEPEIKEYYIPCKRIKYISPNLDNKTLITILRQFLKIHNHDLYSYEKFIKGTKYLIYHIITKQEKENIKRIKKRIITKPITIIFD